MRQFVCTFVSGENNTYWDEVKGSTYTHEYSNGQRYTFPGLKITFLEKSRHLDPHTNWSSYRGRCCSARIGRTQLSDKSLIEGFHETDLQKKHGQIRWIWKSKVCRLMIKNREAETIVNFSKVSVEMKVRKVTCIWVGDGQLRLRSGHSSDLAPVSERSWWRKWPDW